MLFDVHEDVEVAWCCTARASFALARQTDTSSRIDAGRDVDFQLLRNVDLPFAAAIAAGAGDDFTGAVTVGTRPFDDEKALFCANLAVAGAQIAVPLLRAGSCARAVTGIAGLTDLDFDLGRFAVERLFEGHFHVISQVGAATGLSASTTAKGASENGFENVANVTEITARMAAVASAALHSLRKGFVPEPVIGSTFLRILEAFVSAAYCLEGILAFGATRIPVRVMLHRKLAIGGLDRRAVSVPAYAKKFIKIDIGGWHGNPVC